MFFDEVKRKKNTVAKPKLQSYKYSNIAYEEMSDEEIKLLPNNSVFVYDTESYPNYWLIAFKLVGTNKVITFELFNNCLTLNQNFKLAWIMNNFLTVGFNSNNYDNLIVYLAINQFSANDLHRASNEIINGAWKVELEKNYNVKFPKYNHIDLISICPLKGSLKRRAGQLHAKRMQDMPIDPSKKLTEKEIAEVKAYCFNDLANTEIVFNELQTQIDLRCQLSSVYQTDVRSKSDAQIAEAVIGAEFKKLKGFWPKKPKIDYYETVQYTVPDFIYFKTDLMKNKLDLIANTIMKLDATGHPILPESVRKELTFKLGHSTYTMGIGGLHSNEETISHISDDEFVLVDNDVASYYPAIILNQSLYPSSLGETFIDIYSDLVKRRLDAKKAKNKPVAESLKITINGSFGKFSDQFSILYSPKLGIQTTLTGQLAILMIIEALELLGISVISGNTDGFVTKVPRNRKSEFDALLKSWEKHTNFVLEETEYKAIYSQNINNYIAVKTDGKCKTKGYFANPWIDKDLAIFRFHKNPETTICSEAVCEFLSNGNDIKTTIYNCKDITKFVTVRTVKGGAEKDGVYLGKVIRWYYAKSENGFINYCLTGNKVPKSDGAKPLMELPTLLPDDINHDYYIETCMTMLENIGYYKKLRLI